MPDNTASADVKRRVIANFNAIAGTYDGLRFVQVCADRLIELAPLTRGSRVLDIATGTGIVAIAAGEIVGPSGTVVGIDIAPEMLDSARRKLSESGYTHVTFREGDAEQLGFPDQCFDVVLCASSLFFVPNMLAALQECKRVLVPGGYLGFTSFGPSFLRPLRDLWAARLQQYGVTAPWPPTQRLEDPAICRQLLDDAGFAEINVRTEPLGYYLKAGTERWEEIRAGMEGMPLSQLTPAQCSQVMAEHIAEVDALATRDGIWVDVPVHLSSGRKPELI